MCFDMEIINSSLFLPAMRAQSVVKNIPFPHSGIASKLSWTYQKKKTKIEALTLQNKIIFSEIWIR